MDKTMIKDVIAVAGGVVAGLALCYAGYKIVCYLSVYFKEKKVIKTGDVFAEKLKEKETQANKLNDLIAGQTYVELLTAKELTTWFKENRSLVPESAKMIIVTPTIENMKGLGYFGQNDIDVEANVIQVFFDDDSGEVYKIRLVNYTDIESNLQAKLIEQDGMIVVTA